MSVIWARCSRVLRSVDMIGKRARILAQDALGARRMDVVIKLASLPQNERSLVADGLSSGIGGEH